MLSVHHGSTYLGKFMEKDESECRVQSPLSYCLDTGATKNNSSLPAGEDRSSSNHVAGEKRVQPMQQQAMNVAIRLDITNEANKKQPEKVTHSRPSAASSIKTLMNEIPNKEPLFPDVLLKMLGDAETQGFEEIISWAKKGDGAAFKIHNIRYFEQLVLPKYFKMTKYKSFTRQLHNYGFIWIRNGPNKGGYCNPEFPRRASPRILQDRPGIARFPPIGGLSSAPPASMNLIGASAATNGTKPVIPPIELSKLFFRASTREESNLRDGLDTATRCKQTMLLPGNTASSRNVTNNGLHHGASVSYQEANYESRENNNNKRQFLLEEKIATQSLTIFLPPTDSSRSAGDQQSFNFEPRTIEEMMKQPSSTRSVQWVDDLKELSCVENNIQCGAKNEPSSRGEKDF